ncbi:ParA family protein [Cellvibrio japonicus]|uniref:Phage-related regulatory protein cII n=1 Tax=Cellvibrio japonicus (strain Ueda107) TaxID=498211 RepID=B3PE69_CELJU|nr:AAA family ATPase [Cellvibrio japonicus]ACE82886.1 phage-related regulatory protein cII [Cellvibrio japonicus Ueda107]QEI12113.1 ParA family protein [Cellvibrio japonicus]QEI15687.1 ParA family protein [Cellvibrio japonicus]QEI19265.1 ParA family protein [Cellvibrio japonicus]
MKTIAFFNNKGGVGKTSLVYHLAWMYADRGIRTLAIDLDPQANLSAMFLDEERLADLWDDSERSTIYDSLLPLMNRTGDIAPPHVEQIAEKLGLVCGNLALSRFEDLLSENWPKCLDGQQAAFRVITAFHRIIEAAAQAMTAELVLIDVGPNLGAINRSALIASEQVVLPLAPDLFSIQGLKNLGPTLQDWRKGWRKRLDELPSNAGISAPSGNMTPIGYVVMQHGIRDSRPVKAYSRWMEKIPGVYRQALLNEQEQPVSVTEDPYTLALLKHYRSLMPLAMEANKPMFFLKPVDGAIGAHVEAVRACYNDFHTLARKIAGYAGIAVS